MSANERLSAHMGNKIIGPGTHDIKIVGFVPRDENLTITGLTVNGTAITVFTDFWPENVVFLPGELFLFSDSLNVTSITIGAGSATVIKG